MAALTSSPSKKKIVKPTRSSSTQLKSMSLPARLKKNILQSSPLYTYGFFFIVVSACTVLFLLLTSPSDTYQHPVISPLDIESDLVFNFHFVVRTEGNLPAQTFTRFFPMTSLGKSSDKVSFEIGSNYVIKEFRIITEGTHNLVLSGENGSKFAKTISCNYKDTLDRSLPVDTKEMRLSMGFHEDNLGELSNKEAYLDYHAYKSVGSTQSGKGQHKTPFYPCTSGILLLDGVIRYNPFKRIVHNVYKPESINSYPTVYTKANNDNPIGNYGLTTGGAVVYPENLVFLKSYNISRKTNVLLQNTKYYPFIELSNYNEEARIDWGNLVLQVVLDKF